MSISILLAEDSPVIQSVLRGMLAQWGYPVKIAANGLDAWDVLQADEAPPLAIFDWMMPGMAGPELCRKVRAQKREPYTYILLLTSRSDASDIVEGLDAGADDYLTKPFHPQELRARVRAGVRIVHLQQQLVTAREALREQATTDDLTRLLNRPAILAALDREVTASDRAGLPLAVLLVDIDRFRQINDGFGHLAGDIVLREFGARVRAAAPAGAVIGRYSGEEFLMVLPGSSRAEAEGIAASVRQSIAADPFHAGAASFHVTCTIGVAAAPIPYSADAASLLRSADEALLAARLQGRERLAGALRASAVSFDSRVARA